MIDVESLERATLAAVPPRALEELDGWLLGLDGGTIGRAHSAVPLAHVNVSHAALPAIEARYRAHGLPAVFRVADVPGLRQVQGALSAAGYAPVTRTLVQTAAHGGARWPDAAGVRLDPDPDDGWMRMFMGDGFDPQDAASRLEILRRSRASLFARIEEGGRVAAVGCANFSHGWWGAHGMRTAPWARARGHATRILAAFANEAARRGIARSYLQVDASNARALSVYAKAGYATAWAYEYWKQ